MNELPRGYTRNPLHNPPDPDITAPATPPHPFDQVVKLGMQVLIPAAMLTDYVHPHGWRPATPEERAEQDRQRATTRTDTEQAHAQLLAELDGLAREILTLHAPTYDTYRTRTAICEGCDVDGHGDQEQPYWPCRTYRLIAEHHGRTFTNHTHCTRMEPTR